MLFGCFMTKRVLQVISFHLYVHQLGTPVASVNAMHSSAAAAAAQSDDTGGLEPIASGAHVMLTVNLHNKAKATAVHKPIVVDEGKPKQGVTIANATSIAPLDLWEGDVDRLTEGQTYSFTYIFAGQDISRQETTLCSKACSE